MSPKTQITVDGNEAVALVAYKTNEVCAIYPITPSSPMGELSDDYSARGDKNIWGNIPIVSELQSEGGASGAVHGSLQAGALTTTFTASQGLLLMIPNMYKIAGELTSTVFHVSARSLAAQALSIFGDHSDVMSTRSTGFAMMASGSKQEVTDFTAISQAATLESRIPFLHFFDGFRTSHEVSKIDKITDEELEKYIDTELVLEHRKRALSPDKPIIRGTAQNPDVYFQGRETVNEFYKKTPDIVQKQMDKFAEITGRQYKLFDYEGAPDADRVIIIMASGAEVTHEAVEYMVEKDGEKVGVIKVRLYRPFSIEHLEKSLPASVKSIAVLDRTKEPGAPGEPLYQDVITAISESDKLKGQIKTVVSGRYGLSSKEYTPAMVKAIFDELKKDAPKNHFTIGINDDVSNTSLDYDPHYVTEDEKTIRCMFYGLGSDGTVGANKNSIKIIGEETDNYAQGYFVYDSKKAGSVTVSHLRFGPKEIRSSYLISKANFIACHQFVFLEQMDILKNAVDGATFLINAPYSKDEVWDKLPKKVQEQIISKKLKLWVINGYDVAEKTGMGSRINTIMQTCFFAISGILPKDEAIKKIKDAIKKTYSKKGEAIVQSNYKAVDQTLENLHEIDYPKEATSSIEMKKSVPDCAPDFVKEFTSILMEGRGDEIPVSKMPVDGTFPTATSKWEKRNIALKVPVWEPDLCIQCGNCSFVCPHGTIRAKVYPKSYLDNAPENFKHMELSKPNAKTFGDDNVYTLQVAVEDCTGCGACVHNCPAKDKSNPERKAINLEARMPLREKESKNWDYFLSIPYVDREKVKPNVVGVQFLEPLFEFSGACAGCGETPYVKLASQLFGDRMLIANATGCASIYGGNLPTTPFCVDKNGRGPTWSNSLFEDNAEFGFGMRLSVDNLNQAAKNLVKTLSTDIGEDLSTQLLEAEQKTEPQIFEQRKRIDELKKKLEGMEKTSEVKQLLSIADYLAKKSVWIFGGDGWAYDIGYGGLDHVIAQDKDVNILVMDTEVYSNTGGQMSKATNRGAIAKFAAAGKPSAKKDLAMMAINYGTVYVATVNMGANPSQVIKAFIEAEAYNGPSLIIAYSHCVAHIIDMGKGMDNQKLAVDSGYWPLVRFNPELKMPFQLDSKAPKVPFKDYAFIEGRYKALLKTNPERANYLAELSQKDVEAKWKKYERFSKLYED